MKCESVSQSKKVSEIFLRYVAPLSEGAPKDITPEKLQRVFRFPVVIWNAVVMKYWGKPTDYVGAIIDNLSQNGDADVARIGEPMVRMWIQRKEELFANEHWAIEDVVVYRDFSGELIVRVIARAPEEFPHRLPTVTRVQDHRSSLN